MRGRRTYSRRICNVRWLAIGILKYSPSTWQANGCQLQTCLFARLRLLCTLHICLAETMSQIVSLSAAHNENTLEGVQHVSNLSGALL